MLLQRHLWPLLARMMFLAAHCSVKGSARAISYVSYGIRLVELRAKVQNICQSGFAIEPEFVNLPNTNRSPWSQPLRRGDCFVLFQKINAFDRFSFSNVYILLTIYTQKINLTPRAITTTAHYVEILSVILPDPLWPYHYPNS